MLRSITGKPGPSGFGSASTAEQVTHGIDGSNLTAIVTGFYHIYYRFKVIYTDKKGYSSMHKVFHTYIRFISKGNGWIIPKGMIYMLN